jgi:hypothetical protein
MPISKQFCKSQIERFEGLPYYASIGQNGFVELVNGLQEVCSTEEVARLVVSGILLDRTRAMNPSTNRVPTPGEIHDWSYRVNEEISRRPVPRPKPTVCIPCDGKGVVQRIDFNELWKTGTEILLPPETCHLCKGTGKPQ